MWKRSFTAQHKRHPPFPFRFSNAQWVARNSFFDILNVTMDAPRGGVSFMGTARGLVEV